MHLVELIPGPDTLPEVTARGRRYAANCLQKIVVEARDTPCFIANRVGAHFSAVAQASTVAGGFTVDEADQITGSFLSFPASGTFRLMDIIGLDVWAQMLQRLESTDALFKPQPYLTEMIRRNLLGEKTGWCFYRKTTVDGAKAIEVIDLVNKGWVWLLCCWHMERGSTNS